MVRIHHHTIQRSKSTNLKEERLLEDQLVDPKVVPQAMATKSLQTMAIVVVLPEEILEVETNSKVITSLPQDMIMIIIKMTSQIK